MHEQSSSESSRMRSRPTSPTSPNLPFFSSSTRRSKQPARWTIPRLRTLLKFAPIILLPFIYFFYYYEPHVEISVYSKGWVNSEISAVRKLSGCFTSSAVESTYNVTDALYGPRHTEVHAGLSMQLGLDCYDFAATIRPDARDDVSATELPESERTHFHSYWRSDLAPFGPRQEYMIRSFFATQPLHSTLFILWSNGDLSGNEVLQKYVRRYPQAFKLRIADKETLARGTALEGHDVLTQKDSRAWVDGDLVRLLVVYNYGGVWVDMDSLITRSLTPLLEHEFVTQWDCYGEDHPLAPSMYHF